MLTRSDVIVHRVRSWLIWVGLGALFAFACTGAAEFVDASSPASVRAPEPATSEATHELDAGTD